MKDRVHVSLIKNLARSVWANDVLKGSVSALAIKFCAAIVGVAMFALLSRDMDPGSFGTLAIIFNAMSFLAAAALCGQETLIVRSWDEYCQTSRPALARGVLRFGATVALIVPLATAIVVALAWTAWDRNTPVLLAVAACTFLFAQSLMHFSGQFSRVAGGLIIGEVPRELLWRLIVVATIAVHHIVHVGFGTTEFFFVSTGALLLSVLFQVWRVARVLPAAVVQATPQSDVPTWITRSFKMWLSASGQSDISAPDPSTPTQPANV